MKLTRKQAAWVARMARKGRMYVCFAAPPEQIPEWAKREFDLGRVMARHTVKNVSRETAKIASVLPERVAKTEEKVKRYATANRKGWVTRKKQAAACAASEPNRNAA